MTMREINLLIEQWSRMESLRDKNKAILSGYSNACFKMGKVPFADEEKKNGKIVVNNDAGFACM